MRNVLFVCTHNAGRSQIAQALFERHARPGLRAESAGQARPLEKVREIRDDVERRVQDRLARAEEIRAHRSGPERRLAQLLPPLVEEFGCVCAVLA